MGYLKIFCGSFSYFRSNLISFQCKTSLKSVHTLETTEENKIIISNINNYKALHLHRTFHFKTLRDLSKGKERCFFVCLFVFAFFLFSRGKRSPGMECSHLLVCLNQILALKLHSPP